MRLIGQLLLAQAQAQVAAQALVAELARLRVLVQAAVLELAQVKTQRLVQARELELARAAVPESPQSQEPAVEPEQRQARELRVSRQLELQQHRLQAAAQELLPYLPVLPMKAPC